MLEFPILYFSFFLKNIRNKYFKSVPVEVHKYLFPGGAAPKKRAAVVAMRCGVREKEPHITGHSNFYFSARTPFSLPSPLASAPSSTEEKKKGASTLDDHNNSANRKSLRQLQPPKWHSKIQRSHRLSKPLSAAVPRTGECTSRIRRPSSMA